MKVAELSAAVSELGVVAAIAASHMSMPNHWLPYALMGAGQKWSARRTLFVTFLGATGHALTTIATVAILSQLGGAVLSHEAYRKFSCGFLLFIGLYYSYTYFIRRQRDSCCEPKEKDESKTKTEEETRNLTESQSSARGTLKANGKVDGMAALSLIAVTSLSPCVGSMPVLLAFLKPPLTAQKVLLSSLVLLTACAGVMCSFVGLSFIGAKRMDFSRFRRHERLFLGVSFVTLAFLTYFVLTASSHDHSHGHNHGHSESHNHPHDSVVHQSARQAHGLGGGGHEGCH